MAVKRIVVYGGTFDPFHSGHLAVARCLLTEVAADKVLVVPTGRPWLRGAPPAAAPADRLTMARLGTDREPGIEVSDVDVVRSGTTYSIDTIGDLRNVYGKDCDFVLAVGSDAAAELDRWHRIEELAAACMFAVVQRPGALLDPEMQLPAGTVFIKGPMIDVSASEIRELYAARSWSAAAKYVPEPTHRFIIESCLYR